MGDEYRKSYGFGGRGDDIINLPGSFIGNAASQIRVFGGYGDDMILAKSVDDTAGGPSARLYGDEGNDKIYGIHKLSNLSRLEGNDGDDKLISGEEIMVLSSIEGNGGNDIIYGADSGTQEIFIGDQSRLDITNEENDMPSIGGNDKIYGSSNLTGNSLLIGGVFDDLILSGDNIGGDVTIYGDNRVLNGQAVTDYDADGLNINDGDDIIDVGNNNLTVVVVGQGGNDKIIGGYGATQVEKLYGGPGDDKIWLVNPDERAFETTVGQNYGYGGLGDDQIYGTDAPDEIFGDDYNKPNSEDVIVAADLVGGNDVLKGYGGVDAI